MNGRLLSLLILVLLLVFFGSGADGILEAGIGLLGLSAASHPARRLPEVAESVRMNSEGLRDVNRIDMSQYALTLPDTTLIAAFTPHGLELPEDVIPVLGTQAIAVSPTEMSFPPSIPRNFATYSLGTWASDTRINASPGSMLAFAAYGLYVLWFRINWGNYTGFWRYAIFPVVLSLRAEATRLRVAAVREVRYDTMPFDVDFNYLYFLTEEIAKHFVRMDMVYSVAGDRAAPGSSVVFRWGFSAWPVLRRSGGPRIITRAIARG